MTYTIKPGDTLSLIAQRLLGDPNRYHEIVQLNSIPDPNLIRAGDVIEIPSTDRSSVEGLPFSYAPEILYLTGDYQEMRGSVQHRALDFALPVGTPLLALGDSTVVRVIFDPAPGEPRNQVGGGFGRCVTLYDPASDYYWTYAHMSVVSRALYAGASVAAGQEIGKSGGAVDDPGAGYTFGPHLHLQVGKGNAYSALVDPWPLLKEQLLSKHVLKSNDQGIRRRLGL